MANKKFDLMANTPQLLIDNGDGTWSPQVAVGVLSLDAGDLEIGAVELKDATTDTRAKVGTLSGLTAGDAGVAVGDPVMAARTYTTKWSALGSKAVLIAGDAGAPTLKALANNSNKLGDAYDNSTAGTKRDQLALVTLKVTGAVAFTANAAIKLWLLPLTADGTNYEDGADATTPSRDPDFEFTVRAVTATQYLAALLALPPGRFKCLLRNEGGQAFSNVNDENELSMQVVSESEV